VFDIIDARCNQEVEPWSCCPYVS